MAEPKRVFWHDPGGRVVHAERDRDRDVHMVCGASYPAREIRDYAPEEPGQHYRPDCRGCFPADGVH